MRIEDIWDKGLINTLINTNNGNSITQITIKTGMTYSHVLKLIRKLEEKNFLTLKQKGRIIETNLTNKGKNVKDHLIKALIE